MSMASKILCFSAKCACLLTLCSSAVKALCRVLSLNWHALSSSEALRIRKRTLGDGLSEPIRLPVSENVSLGPVARNYTTHTFVWSKVGTLNGADKPCLFEARTPPPE